MSDGYCEVDFGDHSDDADPVEFFNVRDVTARKAHTCSLCSGLISIGERHRVAAFKFEGSFGTDRSCAPCAEAAAEFDYRIFGGNLWEMFADEWDNGAHLQSCLNRLSTARAKEHMRQQWIKWHERRIAQQAKRSRVDSGPDAGLGTSEPRR